MKRFRFSLQTLLNVKESIKKQRQAELAQAQQHAEQCRRTLEASQGKLRMQMKKFREKVSQGVSVEELQSAAKHFVFLRDLIDMQKQALEQAMQEVKRRQEAVIEVMQEVKMLEKLREKQFQAYREEVRREEEKEIGDFVSYMVGSGENAGEGER